MKKVFKGILVFTAVLTLAACGQGKTNESSLTKESTLSSTSSEAKKDTLEITDAEGTVTVPFQPKKVVVFDNSALDTMQVLGVSETVIGAATDSLPEFLASFSDVESAGGIKEPDLEKINQLAPDLIIISGRQRDFKADLEKIAPTIFLNVDAADTWNSVKHNVEVIAQIFGKEDVATEKLAALQTKIDETSEKAQASGLKSLVVLVNEGSLSAYGQGSRFGIVHDTFGFLQADDNIEASTHGQNVSYEYILEKNPDLLFVIDRTKAIGGDASQNAVADNDLVKETNAGKNNKVIALNPQVWYLAGSGLESIEIMLDDVNHAFE
ncbi:siderophore ABC transporter substrate-binding protein [Enterococcus lemanii]|uniref:Siderophore ABC transporter substrate-binding protein n=1 Tax=Enterococcus lemanii TaxID=1159752 RepID=A0ABV9MXY8_9ENTE|nr:siderophore ABC transporter substrate-binding protein [Enterococcus lemanii]MBM7709622.1 iron complex transport system substrate-binding protein [Enterococcus lemanii]NLM65828.1 siderophore ABC transporter substrate-binding protein [Enterococcus sp.]